MNQAGFRVDGLYGEGEWDPQLVFGIENDGKWVPLHCSEGSGKEIIEYLGKEFASSIFYQKLWTEGPGVMFKVYT